MQRALRARARQDGWARAAGAGERFSFQGLPSSRPHEDRTLPHAAPETDTNGDDMHRQAYSFGDVYTAA
eukprot:357881-Chlamydomonas_euryale.AAC.22